MGVRQNLKFSFYADVDFNGLPDRVFLVTHMEGKRVSQELTDNLGLMVHWKHLNL